MKISYSTMPNMGQQLKQHNSKLTRGQQQLTGGCNGHRGGRQCSIPDNCMAERVVYTAEVTDSNTGERETYIGLTGTRLSSHIWHLKDRGHHQFENPGEGKHLQPLVWHVPVEHA